MQNLSPSQFLALDRFKEVLHGKKNELLVMGPAGSGKSFLIRHMLDLLYKRNDINRGLGLDLMDARVVTTTNKAAQVLRSMGHPQAVTIHKALGLKPVPNYKTGKTELKRNLHATPMLTDDASMVVFIDEVGMLDSVVMKYLKQLPKVRKIYVGDPYQLPPVEEGRSIVFETVKNSVNLTEVHRHGNNTGILDAAEHFKTMLDSGSSRYPSFMVDGVCVHRVDVNTFKQEIDTYFRSTNSTIPNDQRILAWTNRQVNKYNDYVRRANNLPKDFAPGEIVITNKPIMSISTNPLVKVSADPDPDVFRVDKALVKKAANAYSEPTILAHTDKELEIVEMRPATVEIEIAGVEYSLPGNVVLLRGNHHVRFLPDKQSAVNQLKRKLAKLKDWTTFFYLGEHFLDLRPSYAQTCHKAQGSTYERVFIDAADIRKNPNMSEVARLMYVAITRASKEVYLYGG